jgi:hypothetical protein
MMGFAATYPDNRYSFLEKGNADVIVWICLLPLWPLWHRQG